MDWINSILNQVFAWYFAAFAWSPAVGLVVISILAGILALLMIRWGSEPARITVVKKRAQAHLMELMIFDEPRVIWKAQKSLVTTNLRYMGLMLRPALFASIPILLLMVRLEAYYGRDPLPVGHGALVTMGMNQDLEAAPVLTTPQGTDIETPAVRALALREVSWRIRPRSDVSGVLKFQVGDQTIEKRIEAGGGQRFVPGLRTGSWWKSVVNADEPHIAAAQVQWIDIEYPEAEVALFGMRAHWLAWFLGISIIAGLILKKPLGVVL